MYIDLFSKGGRYRGLSRTLRMIDSKRISNKEWVRYFDIYEGYLNWQAKMDNTFNNTVLQMLIKLRDVSQKLGNDCEITFFTDDPKEFHQTKGFLGFDAYCMEEGISGLDEGHETYLYYPKRLNENGLLCNYEDALAFCITWENAVIDPDSYDRPIQLRPFCIWIYEDEN